MKNYLREVRKDRGITLDKLAELSGLSTSYISRIESGAREFSAKNMNLLAKALGCQVTELISKASALPSVSLVPVLSWVQAGDFAEAIPSLPLFDCERVPVVNAENSNLFALKVRGHSMNMIAPEGSHIIVNPFDKELTDGRYYVVLQEEQSTFKRYRENPVRLEPVSSDPTFETIFPTNGTEVVGRVIKIVNDL